MHTRGFGVATPTPRCRWRINTLCVLAWNDSDAGRESLDCSDVVVTPVCLYARDVYGVV